MYISSAAGGDIPRCLWCCFEAWGDGRERREGEGEVEEGGRNGVRLPLPNKHTVTYTEHGTAEVPIAKCALYIHT